jgi:hypothetical protein
VKKSLLDQVAGHVDLDKGRQRIGLGGLSTLDGATEDYAEFRRLSMSAAHPSSTQGYDRDERTGVERPPPHVRHSPATRHRSAVPSHCPDRTSTDV